LPVDNSRDISTDNFRLNVAPAESAFASNFRFPAGAYRPEFAYNRPRLSATTMTSLHRRTFLETVSTIAVGGLVAGTSFTFLTGATPQSKPHIDFPSAPRDRISVASYPFRMYMNAPGNRDRDAKLKGFELTQFPAEVVEKFGVHNIEPLAQHFQSTDAAYLDTFRSALQKANVHVVNIPTHVRASFYDTDPSARQQAVTVTKKWIDVAVAVGSPGVRPHINGTKSSGPDVQRAAESLKLVADYAAQKNIVVTLENDDPETEDAFFIVKVIDAVNHPYLRALPDFANSVLKGDLDFNYRAVTAMFERAYNISHVKDGEADDHGKQFDIDLKKTFDIARAANYRGYYSMEFDAPGDPYSPTKKLIEQTIRNLS
jgi:sugar phosphate isomerase/epimerase